MTGVFETAARQLRVLGVTLEALDFGEQYSGRCAQLRIAVAHTPSRRAREMHWSVTVYDPDGALADGFGETLEAAEADAERDLRKQRGRRIAACTSLGIVGAIEDPATVADLRSGVGWGGDPL